MNLLNKMGFWDKVGTIFDVIPKVIYYLYAALASGVDALQALVRKLAGLDSYWTATAAGGANAVVQHRDPLSEFVYGILGVGQSASVYKALNTVFWSLAIFGLIMLVVSTMIAIIKSHYNEDTGATSPWKYIYTAIKAILTFVVIPVVVVLGMQLSTFALDTLDRIIAGSAGEGAITGIYGGDVATKLEHDENTNTYAHYDFFGARDYTTSTPFSGMLFKAAGYNANRIRTGSYSVGDLKNLTSSIFGQTSDQSTDYAAYQVDYAFSNCLMFKDENKPEYQTWVQELDGVPVALMDIWKLNKVSGFSKWDVSVVWLFYDLWRFNFIVGFAGVTTCFGVLVSIVFGLLTRLIKGAALFLVFPALLGIAPMDNFKAFKSWGTQFMQLILMVFGAILGMNLLLLVLPYIQNISFFDPNNFALNVLNAIMDVVILIVGLQMAKDFINIVNGFVGGSDAVAAGDGVKDNAKKAMISGAKTAIGAGKIGVGALAVGAKGVIGAGKVVGKGAKGFATMVTARGATARAERRDARAESAIGAADEADEALRRETERNQGVLDYYRGKKEGDAESAAFGRRIADAGAQAREKATNAGLSSEAIEAKGKEAEEREFKKILSENDYEKDAARLARAQTASAKAHKRADKAADSLQHTVDAHGLIYEDGAYKRTKTTGEEIGIAAKGILKAPFGERATYRVDESGEFVRDRNGRKVVDKAGSGLLGMGSAIARGLEPTGAEIAGFGQKVGKSIKDSLSWSSIGKNIADGFTKSVNTGFQVAGVDKLTKDLQDVGKSFKQSTFKTPEAFEGKEGDKLTKEVAKAQQQRDEKMQSLLEKIVENTTPRSGGTT